MGKYQIRHSSTGILGTCGTVWDGLALGLIHVARIDCLGHTAVTMLLREDHAECCVVSAYIYGMSAFA